MKTFSRRDVLKSSLLAPAVAATAHALSPIDPAVRAVTSDVSGPLSAPATVASPTPGAGRERLLLDFGWSFHLGNADDPAKDFGYGSASRWKLPEDRKLHAGRFYLLQSKMTGDASICHMTGPSNCLSRMIPICRARASILSAANTPKIVSAGTAASSRFQLKMRASASPSSSMVHIAKRQSCSTASISASTAVATIPSALTSQTSPIPASPTCSWCA